MSLLSSGGRGTRERQPSAVSARSTTAVGQAGEARRPRWATAGFGGRHGEIVTPPVRTVGGQTVELEAALGLDRAVHLALLLVAVHQR